MGFITYNVNGSILSDESEMLEDVEIIEINEFLFPTGVKTKTDDGGQFSMNLQSDRSSISISKFGYIPVMITAKDFMKDGLLYLSPAVNIKGTSKPDNTLLYVGLGLATITIIILATRPAKTPQPKQIKIT